MRFIVCENYEQMSEKAADIFAAQLTLKPDSILGLATGTTPIGTYDRLVEMNKAGKIDFSKVKTFNLDEYYPIKADNDQSYRYFMNKYLFDRVNIDKANTHVPNGEAVDPDEEGKNYDKMLAEAGGVDVQLLGIGRNGHIAFNEPDSYLIAGTHKTALTEDTIEANSRLFNDISEVPHYALTMGMASIMSAKTIVLLANGRGKHDAIVKLLDDKITPDCPASFLKLHPNVIIICDKEAYEG